jgi:hypothetical protein
MPTLELTNEIEHALKLNTRKANLSNDILGIANEQTMRRLEDGLNYKMTLVTH